MLLWCGEQIKLWQLFNICTETRDWGISGVPLAYPWRTYIVGNGDIVGNGNINFVTPLS